MEKLLLTLFFILGLSLEGILCEWSWSYRNDNGPKYWSKRKSDCSGDVQHQSPIDIPKPPGRKYDKSMQKMVFVNYEQDIKGDLKNYGNLVKFQKLKTTNDKNIYLTNGSLEIGSKYVATEFHYHFGTKDDGESGHRFEGNKYPMELHIVHYKEEYKELKKATEYHDGVIIVVFFLEREENNKTNTNYQALTSEISQVKFKDDKKEDVKFGFSLRDITNDNIQYKMGKGKHLHFFEYEGTIQEPPCYYVHWMVFKDTVKLSPFQLGLFRHLKRVKDRQIQQDKYDSYDKMAPNYRPIQELGDRTVYESYESGSTSTNAPKSALALPFSLYHFLSLSLSLFLYLYQCVC